MPQLHLVKLKSSAGTGTIIYSKRNKRSVQNKLELKKYDPKIRKHVIFKEIKK